MKKKSLECYMQKDFEKQFRMEGANTFKLPKLPPRWHWKNENHPIKVRITIEETQ